MHKSIAFYYKPDNITTKNIEKTLFQPKITHFIQKMHVFMHINTAFHHRPDNISTKNNHILQDSG